MGMQVEETLQLRRDRAAKGGRTIIDGDDGRVLRMSAKEQKKWLRAGNLARAIKVLKRC